MDKHAIVIGASAVGSITAKELARKGIEVDLLEEDSRVGKFGKCGGIFSKHGMDYTGVQYKDLVLNQIKGARIIAGKEEMIVRTPQTQAVVLSRQAFDERAADEAVSGGVNLHLNSRVRNFETQTDGKLKVMTGDKGDYEANVVIGCDGNSSVTARKLSFPPIATTDYVISYQAEFSKAKVPDREIVDLILDHNHYRNFFAWTIPISEERMRIGVATTDIRGIEKSKKAAFETPFLREAIEGAHKTFEFTHAIPLKYRKQTQKKFGKSYALLVGDAAGQVKATSGGGVNFGAKCAKVAAIETTKYLNESGKMDYESQWRKRHGEMLKFHYLLHRGYRLMPNWFSEFSLGAMKRLGMGSFLEKFGDMDYVFKF